MKWNGLYFLAGFAVYALVVDALARRRAGIPFWLTGTALKQAPATFLLMVPVAALVYLASWTGWFVTEGGYDRQWAAQPGNAWTGPLAWVPHALQSLWHFQVSVYDYHVGETRPHGYQANPLTWLLMVRPTSMYYRSIGQGESGCTSTLCGESITGIANPLIWWAATAAVVYLLVRLVRRREWRAGLVLMGVAAGYLPWLLYLNRTVFQFYTIVFEPYLLLALVLVHRDRPRARERPVMAAGRRRAHRGGLPRGRHRGERVLLAPVDGAPGRLRVHRGALVAADLAMSTCYIAETRDVGVFRQPEWT